jgi:hypothetical protein
MNDRKSRKLTEEEIEARKSPTNPLYPAFTYQMSATLEIARKMKEDKSYSLPRYVERFLEEFGRKTVT